MKDIEKNVNDDKLQRRTLFWVNMTVLILELILMGFVIWSIFMDWGNKAKVTLIVSNYAFIVFLNVSTTFSSYIAIEEFKFKNISSTKDKVFISFIMISLLFTILNPILLLIFAKDKNVTNVTRVVQGSVNKKIIKRFMLEESLIVLGFIVTLFAVGLTEFVPSLLLKSSMQDILGYVLFGFFISIIIHKVAYINLLSVKTGNKKADKTILIIAWSIFWIPILGSVVWTFLLMKKNELENNRVIEI
ncbi:hypothetical protein SCHIN_v1c09710 [Spiroplasma chinense]|uniref:Uncharacterized protein n=1 Tax=Spiroplasma chinense TaxID=216932 RepID=A0A5B9Y4Z4_9MOLU|nr:hypothetical protein [Spiroplasma chinense]QEH62164.1 hypothetical protein SCHIN_v1c09710 [Spiroplasma chinense]